MADLTSSDAPKRRSARGSYLESLRKAATVNGRTSPGYDKIAEALGVSKTSVYNWFRYDRHIDPENVWRLASLLAGNAEDAAAVAARLTHLNEREADHEDQRFDPGQSLFDRIKNERPVRIAFVDYAPVAAPGERPSFLRRLWQLFAESAGLTWVEEPPNDKEDLTDLSRQIRDGTLDLACGLMMTPDRQRSVHFLSTPLRLPLEAVVLKRDVAGAGDLTKSRPWVQAGLAQPGDTAAAKLTEFCERLLDPVHVAEINSVERFAGLLKPIVRKGEVGHSYVEQFLGFDGGARNGGGRSVPGHTPTLVERYDPGAYSKAIMDANRESGLPVMFADLLACVNALDYLNKNYADPGELLFSTRKLDIAPPAYFVGFACDREDEKFISYFTVAFDTFLETYPDQIATLYLDLYKDLCTTTIGIMDDNQTLVRRWMGLPPVPLKKDEKAVGVPSTSGEDSSKIRDDGSEDPQQVFLRDTSSATLRPWRSILARTAEKINKGLQRPPSQNNVVRWGRLR